ncbi:MAG: reductase [Mycobacteriales bacterium]|nr:reductase [Mycobacteriales bacterium]
MEVLVLGGTRFVGRAVVADALARGWSVTALHRGLTGALPEGVRALVADRTSYDDTARALEGLSPHLVVDTWSGAPVVVQHAVRALVGRGRYGYVSSVSVYLEGRPPGGDESAPVWDADPAADSTVYPADKRGSELAVLSAYPDALLARAGFIVGPHEDIGRLPWWLDRISRGGRVVAPGRPDRPLQLVDARDLAAWLLSGLETGVSGPVDVTGLSGHVTTRSLLEACVAVTGSDAELVWVPQDELGEAQPWAHLPCWVPEGGEFAGFMEGDASRAAATGLVTRPIEQTVRDTWAWLQAVGPAPQRADRAVHGLPLDLEAALLARR